MRARIQAAICKTPFVVEANRERALEPWIEVND